ncbi:DUF3046 domain-containing protein [Nocardioides pacificus]
MRFTEFWSRLEEGLGVQATLFAEHHVIAELGNRTVTQALDAGVPAKEVWAAVWRDQRLPESLR